VVKLSEHTSGDATRILYLGNSGAGKTGSLVSLVEAGYNLRILDMDNGVSILKQFILNQCPERIGQVDVETRRDVYEMGLQGPRVKGKPKAYVEAMQLLDKWSDGSHPAEWDRKTIFVLDSLSALGRACFEYVKAMNPSVREPRQWYNAAQDMIQSNIANMTGAGFNPHVIVCTHVRYEEDLGKAFANAIGKALGPVLPRYFNNMVLAETVGAGKMAKRIIKTVTTGTIDLKNENPFKVAAELPLETGMATLFKSLQS